MSSFIVDEKTIHRIVTHIDMHQGKLWFEHVCSQLRTMGYDLSSRAGLDRLGADLVALNYRATNYRYKSKDVPATRYEYQHERAATLQVLKSLQCLMYQCSEGNVPETQLFEWLESYEHSLMRNIIDGMPEYAAAAWG